MAMPQKFDTSTSALVLIDLQTGITSFDVAPHTSADVIARAAQLADAFRQADRPVVLVHVTPSADGRDGLAPDADAPMISRDRPADWADFVPELKVADSDIVITKRQWGAFYGTELDLQLRRRGIKTIVLGGIATNIGCESTARDAYERGYNQLFVEDAMASFSAADHQFAFRQIFPRIGRVVAAQDVLAAVA